MKKIAERFKEPSTWAGLSVLAGLFGVQVAPEVLQGIIQIGSGAAAVASILLPENKGL